VTRLLQAGPGQALAKSQLEEFLRKGMQEMNAQRWTQAANYNCALEINPDCGEALFKRGLALISVQCIPEALSSLEKAV
jgi:hypothetical protein